METTQLRSGLVVAENSADEQAMSRALKRLDPDLILVKDIDPRHQTWVWKVLCWTGDDRPAVHVLDWRDASGKPLPLTGRIVDAVDEQRKDRPGGYDAIAASDRANEELRARRQKEFEDVVDDISGEFAATLERGRVSVGLSSKPIPGWLRNQHLPERARRSTR